MSAAVTPPAAFSGPLREPSPPSLQDSAAYNHTVLQMYTIDRVAREHGGHLKGLGPDCVEVCVPAGKEEAFNKALTRALRELGLSAPLPEGGE